jgi:hypothetical protein
VVCVIAPPDAHAGGRVKAQVLPGTPQGRNAGDRFGVEVPLDAPLRGLSGDAADVCRQQLLVKELFGRAVCEPVPCCRDGAESLVGLPLEPEEPEGLVDFGAVVL